MRQVSIEVTIGNGVNQTDSPGGKNDRNLSQGIPVQRIYFRRVFRHAIILPIERRSCKARRVTNLLNYAPRIFLAASSAAS